MPDRLVSIPPLHSDVEQVLREGYMPLRPDYVVPRLLASLDAARALDVQTLADVLTEYHVRREGFCSESHLADAYWLADRYTSRRLGR